MSKPLKPLKLSIVFILVVSIMLTGFTYATEPYTTLKTIDEKLSYLKGMMEYVRDSYKDEVTEEELIDGAFNGMFEVLDKHSTYYTSDEFKDFDADALGQFGGVGISIGIQNDYITVISPIEGTPAYKAGIKAGDIIKYVDNIDITGFGLEKAVQLMRGEPGTNVTLGIIREGSTQVQYFNIVRDIIRINPVSFEVIDDTVGYIRITQFNENTDENVKIAIKELNKTNIQGIVVDLRDNPGGILTEVIKVADLFLDKDQPIVHVDYRSYKDKTFKSEEYSIMDKPLVVLVNRGSASASEIFAGAIKDNNRGAIVGIKTYGKGTVQNITPLTNGGGIKLTVAEYLTANKTKIDGIGITPDIIVENIRGRNRDKLLTFAPMVEEKIYKQNEKGLNIYGAQQRLNYFGYDVIPTAVLDNDTYEAIKKFQEAHGLDQNGVLDLETRDKINKEVLEIHTNDGEDLQLKKAIETIKK